MRLRGLVFERFVTFDRAEVDLCDESGAPLDVILFVGESGVGKSALLRGISALLSEGAGAEEQLGAEDVLRGGAECRCRLVFDDVVEDGRVVITLEKEVVRTESGAPPLSRPIGLRAQPPGAFERWRAAALRDAAPRAAFSIATGDDGVGDPEAEGAADDELFGWAASLARTPAWGPAAKALDRVLWPWRFHRFGPDGDLVFDGPSGLTAASELGDGFASVLVMALELARLSSGSPGDELVYVIDDIDAHLHPGWKARLVGDLRRAFPRVQLVASTHSPWVAASVEPNQVFVLRRDGGATAIERASERINRSASVSNVMDIAFGAPELPGPRWAHQPPLAIRRDVLRAVEDGLERGAVVYALPELIHVKDVRDAFGEPLLPATIGGVGHVFFIDRAPGAPWGHACEYVFRAGDGALARQTAIWPPPNLHRFVPIGRG